MTFHDICGHTLNNINLRLHNDSLHRNVHQNRFINEWATYNLAKIP